MLDAFVFHRFLSGSSKMANDVVIVFRHEPIERREFFIAKARQVDPERPERKVEFPSSG